MFSYESEKKNSIENRFENIIISLYSVENLKQLEPKPKTLTNKKFIKKTVHHRSIMIQEGKKHVKIKWFAICMTTGKINTFNPKHHTKGEQRGADNSIWMNII